MKKVYFKPPPSPAYLNNGLFRIKSVHNTFFDIDKKFLKHDIAFSTIDLDKNNDGDLYVFSEAPYPWETQSWRKIIAIREKNVLFCLESPLVNPFSHLTAVHTLFKKIYSWEDKIIDGKKYCKFYIQQTSFGLNTKPRDFKQKKFLSFINNKKNIPFPFWVLSRYKKNLYTERFSALDFFSRTIPGSFDFFGKGWGKPIPWDFRERIFGVKRYASYRGEHKGDKIELLSKYKFCLCFENAVAPGYITEKIFDCFKARCVPVYWGAPNVEKYIDKQCYIDFRNFADYESLLFYLQNMTEAEYQKYIEAINKFMQKKSTKNIWFADKFIDIVLENLK